MVDRPVWPARLGRAPILGGNAEQPFGLEQEGSGAVVRGTIRASSYSAVARPSSHSLRTTKSGSAHPTLAAHTLIAYYLPMGTLWTVVETPSYLSRAEKIFSASERAEIVTMLASDPECGEIMQGTGGVRKVRVAVGGRGKSGGARVIYYFHGSESLPILIFAVFTKNEKANLSDTEKNNLAKLTQAIKARAK